MPGASSMESLGEVIQAFINGIPDGGSVPFSYIREKAGWKYTDWELLDAAKYLIEKYFVFLGPNIDGTVYGLTETGELMRGV